VSGKLLCGALLMAVVLTGCGSKGSSYTAGQAPTAGVGGGSVPANPAPTSPGTLAVKADSSKATYTVEETFVGRQGIFKAIGTTSGFEGALDLKDGRITGGTVKVDLRTLKSDSGQRDRTIQGRFLESNKYPYATYVISGMEGDGLKAGSRTPVTLKGKMTIHDTEKELTFKGEGALEGGLVKLQVTATFKMTDFGVTPPDLAGMLKAEDPVVLDIEVTAGN
jgi:polyisoprenoid-binding protein YceI